VLSFRILPPYIHSHIHTQTHLYLHTHTHTCILTKTYTNTFMHTRKHTRPHANTHTYIHTYTHACTHHARTHAHSTLMNFVIQKVKADYTFTMAAVNIRFLLHSDYTYVPFKLYKLNSTLIHVIISGYYTHFTCSR
jgi:hypothetical protein